MVDTGLTLNREFAAPYGEAVAVSPHICRVLAPNPGPFTFRGTSTAIVGSRRVVVIDPGPDDMAHLDALRRALAGHVVSHILVTHTHRDHSPASRVLKEWTGAPLLGFGPHPPGAEAIEEGPDRDFVPDIVLRDGDLIEGEGFTLDCVHTPGHTPNHLCFALREEKALFSGDHVMGWSTTVVAPPDGDMADYMAGLEKLLARSDEIYWPTHGGPIRNPQAFVSALLRHRQMREAEVLAALRDGIAMVPAMVDRIYRGLDPRLHRAAELNVLAHLIKLTGEGRAAQLGDGAGPRFYAK